MHRNGKNFTEDSISILNREVRNENRFGFGQGTFSDFKIEFYPSKYKSSLSIEQVIDSDGSNSWETLRLKANAAFYANEKNSREIRDSTSQFYDQKRIISMLLEQERCLIYKYTFETPFCEFLNKIMRENIQEEIEKQRDFIFYLTETIEKLPKYQGLVFRAFDAKLHNYVVGKEFTWADFSASTGRPIVALNTIKRAPGKREKTSFFFVTNSRNTLRNQIKNSPFNFVCFSISKGKRILIQTEYNLQSCC